MTHSCAPAPACEGSCLQDRRGVLFLHAVGSFIGVGGASKQAECYNQTETGKWLYLGAHSEYQQHVLSNNVNYHS